MRAGAGRAGGRWGPEWMVLLAPAHPLSPTAAPQWPQSRQDTLIQPLVTPWTLVSHQFSEGGGRINILLCYGGVSHVTMLQQ